MKMKVLFVGNSYTYFYDMPKAIFAPLSESIGYETDVTAVTAGGYYLSQFADPENPEGQRLREVIQNQHYDAVVLQEQSTYPVRDPEAFIRSVGKMRELLSPHTHTFVLYATWGRHENCPILRDLGLSSAEMTDRLSFAYHKAAERHGMDVADVGRAFAAYAEQHGQDGLFDPDGSHPSALGSRIAAETILAALTAALAKG